MKQTKIKKTIALGLTGLSLVAGSANAATVLIDISTSGGSPAAPAGDGKYWNSLGSGSTDVAATALVDSTNTASGFSLSIDVTNVVSGGTSGAGFGGAGIDGPSGADPFDEATAITDGIFANNNTNGTAVFTLSGLTASTQFNFSAIGGRASGGVDGAIDILTGTSGTSSYTLANDGTVLDFSVTSTAGGLIEFEFREGTTNGTPDNATFNAFSFTQIPEPSAALLGGLGFLALLRRRR